MRVLLILVIVLAALLLLLQIRFGGRLRFTDGKLEIKLLAGPFRFLLYPRRAGKMEKGEHPVKKGSGAPAGESIKLFRELLPVLLEAASCVKRKIRVDDIQLALTVAADDPAMAAVAFGGANALLGMIWPQIENNFNVKKRSVRTQVDFQRTEPELSVQAAFTMTAGQLMAIGIHYGVKTLKCYRNWKNADRKAEHNGKEPSHS